MGLVKTSAIAINSSDFVTERRFSQISSAGRRPGMPWHSRSGILPRRSILVSLSPLIIIMIRTLIPPSLTMWYPRHKLQYRVGLFFGAATLAGQSRLYLTRRLDEIFIQERSLGFLPLRLSSWMAHKDWKRGLGYLCAAVPWIFKLLSNSSQILEGIATVAVGFLALTGTLSARFSLKERYE